MKTNITINLRNTAKDFDKLVADTATNHDKKRILQGIDFKIEAMNDTLNNLGVITTKTISMLSTAPTDEPDHKDELDREEMEQQFEFDSYKEKVA